MSLTFTAARDDIFKMVDDALSVSISWPDKPFTIPDRTAWARAVLQHSNAGTQSLKGGLGKATYERQGVLIVQVFTPSGQGLSEAYDMCKLLADAFEGKASPNGVWFRRARINEADKMGDYSQVNFIVEFSYDEVK
jgi:hypothetical protein